MIIVAIPGGTSLGLGRAVVTAIQEYPDQLQPVVLSRQSSKTPEWLEESRIEVRKVDYDSEDACFEALQGVHTVICVLLAADGTGASKQKNLLNGGLRAGISRFAPADFGCGPLATHSVDMFVALAEVKEACRDVKKNNPDFEFAAFHGGMFMNYLGYGAPDEKAATCEMSDTWVFVWDVKNMKAALPLDPEGEVPRSTMTEIGDVGRFTAAACLLPKGFWQEDFSMEGETLAMNEVVNIIEKVRGEKMSVTHRPYKQIAEEEAQEQVVYPQKFWLQIEILTARSNMGEGIVPPTLNALCPSVKPMSVEDYMTKFWL